MGTLILSLISNQALAEEIHFIQFHKFEMVEDGRLTDIRIVAFINITESGGKLHVNWKDVVIRPDKNLKKIILNSDSHSTYNNRISNVKVSKDYFSFTIHTWSPLVGRRDVNIVGNKKGENKYEITGMGIWWSDTLKKTIKTEFRTVDKIMLPYNEVY